jgi:hypothetical protein
VNPLLILAGAFLTAGASLSAGLLLFQRLSIVFYRQEVYPYAFVTGAALFSLLIFLLNAAGLAYTWTFVAAAAIVIAACLQSRAWRRRGPSLPALPRAWSILFASAMAVYGVLYLAYAMAPEASPDGSAYHLGLVRQYFRQHGFGRITTNMYANITMGIEMLYLSAYSVGRHSSAAVVHWTFLITLPALVLAFARRRRMPGVGMTAALLVFCAPVVGVDGSTAYIDVALAAVAFGFFCVMQVWAEEKNNRLLVVVGLLAGFAYACKLTAFVAVPYALLFVSYKLLRARRPVLKPLVLTAACAAFVISPWLIKNAVVVQNPFSPFLNRVFPNPHTRISFEEDYAKSLRTYDGLESLAQIPAELTIRGAVLNGFIGPVFLLTPIILLAARWPLGRQVLLAALVFASIYPANIGTRFLIAALPFVALALALVLAHWRLAAPIAIFHAVISWPTVLPMYCHEHAWRIDGFRWRAALRLDSEDAFLRAVLPGYAAAQLANQYVPRGGKILSFQGIAEAYSDRDILVCYQGALNTKLCEMWVAAQIRHFLPSRHWNFQFPEIAARKLRLVQTRVTPESWSVSEFRVFSGANEVARQSPWKLRAHPNPWDVQLSFDNCFLTRWKTWQESRPGMFIEVDFGAPLQLTGAVAEITGDNSATAGRLEAEIEPGRWQSIGGEPEETPAPVPANVRRTAMQDLRRSGITHLAVVDSDFIANEMFRNRAAWGVTLIGYAGGCRLYKIGD